MTRREGGIVPSSSSGSPWKLLKRPKTINQVASESELHPNQVSQWKKQLLDEGISVFSSTTARQQREQEARETELYEQIGRLKMELEWLKKRLDDNLNAKRAMIEATHPDLSIRRQCELICLNRSTFCYQPAMESPLNLQLMRLIDEQYTKTPFYGYPRMTAHLRRLGHRVNPKRVRRLMRKTGLQAVYAKPRTSVPAKGHRVYPYLLRGLAITHPNQACCADITYVPMSQAFTGCLEAVGVRASMAGRGRVMDNIIVERLWRTVKYEDIYLKYVTVPSLEDGLRSYFTFYIDERPHQSLGYRVPAEVHTGSC